jgi:DHA1 family bicyclomycin/chloramphenicol resistance-like MFS transporter
VTIAEPCVGASNSAHAVPHPGSGDGTRLPAGTRPAGRLRLILVLGGLIALGPLSIDLYLPALPRIALDLHAADSDIQLTLTGMLLGLGLGQLLVGPLSDAIGRRKPLVVGTAVHVLASLACLVAPTVALLDTARVLQGLGASAGAVLALAVVRDLFDGRPAATMLSRLILVLSVSPILAPSLGTALLTVVGWRWLFAVLAGLGLLVTVFAAVALPETLPARHRRPLRLRATAATYAGLLANSGFLGMVLVAGLAMAGLFAFVSGAPFVFQQQYGLDQRQFGLLFSVSVVWMIGATQLNARLLRRYEPHQVLVAAGVAAGVAAVALLGAALTGFGGLAGLLGALWVVLFCTGLMMPNAPAVALSAHGEVAGTAAALLGAVQFGVGALVSPLVGVLGNNAVAMSAVIAGGLVLAALVLVLLARPWRLAPASGTPTVVTVH